MFGTHFFLWNSSEMYLDKLKMKTETGPLSAWCTCQLLSIKVVEKTLYDLPRHRIFSHLPNPLIYAPL